MPRKPAHEQFDTLQAIQDHAFELFGRFGYEGVSIGDIAKAAKLSKGALYWHFRGKAELYLDCQARLHALFNQYIFAPMKASADPVAGTILMFRGLEQLSRDARMEKGVAGYWLVPSSSETEPLFKAQRQFELDSQATIRDVLERGMAQGRFDLAGDLEDMSRAIISLIEAVVLPMRHMATSDVHRMMAVLARTLFRAYAKGDELRELARSF
ncbi:MAG TPA: helix-turn-helix domain-containing protein [Steroidobacteraceae bacterium]|nr:helix-turn-helix domain-containing protein [Steroidobacteraceae bacterium]